jgi:hypothetical protein
VDDVDTRVAEVGPYGLAQIDWHQPGGGPLHIEVTSVINMRNKYAYIITVRNTSRSPVLDAYLRIGKEHELEEAKQFMLDLAYARYGGV